MSPLRVAVVFSCVVSEPVVGSVTPNACSRSSPVAIFGRNARFCASEPCRSSVPIVYICAWQAPALPPLRLISSRMIEASVTPRPEPPYVLGNQRREIAGAGERLDERVGIGARGVELAPVAVGKRLAQVADGVSQILMKFDARHGVMIDHVV